MTKSNRKCDICGAGFYAKPSRIKNGWAKYCSSKCRATGAGKQRLENYERKRCKALCAHCGDTFNIRPSRKKKFEKSYCSRECMAKSYRLRMRNDKNPNYKDGRSLEPKYMAKWSAKRKKTDLKYRLNRKIQNAIYSSLIRRKGGWSWEKLVGYTVVDLMKHLEGQFKDGMTWDNYGQWHIDHKIPISVFNYSNPHHDDFKKCWALKNLQPLWALQNIRKGNKLYKPFQPSLKLIIDE